MQEAITWTNVNQVLWRYMEILGLFELITFGYIGHIHVSRKV